MRLLFARIGIPHCTNCGRKISTQSIESITDSVIKEFSQKKVLVLAPLIQRKKGTYEKLFEQMKKDGYSRARVNGEIILLEDEFPKLDRQKWHNIEIVVDRIIASKSDKSRIFEGIQTALKAAKGSVLVASEKNEKIFSQNNACPHCGITVGELEPRTFSFNSPFGMCNQCNGLGVKMEFDPDLVIPDKTKSILDGAIVPWSGRFSSYRKQELRVVGKKYKFNLMTPMNQMKSKQIKVILYGTEDVMKFSYEAKTSDTIWEYTDAFEGVLNNLQRKFMETDSESKREWLKQFMRDTPCLTCQGRKLKPEALAVKINSKNIMEVCDLSIDSSYEFFNKLELTDTEQFIARDIL